MEKEPNNNINYEKVLRVDLKDTSPEELKRQGFFRFAVTPQFNIFLSRASHEILSEVYGADLDLTLTEGTVEIEQNGNITVGFKNRFYQPIPGFKGSDNEFALLQQAVKIKIIEFIKS